MLSKFAYSMKKNIFIILWLLMPLPCFAEVVQFEANESPPFWSEKMPFNGMCGEILQAMSELAGLQSRITFKPLNRLIDDTENNDLGNPDFYLQKNDFVSIIPIAIYQSAFYYYRPNHPAEITLSSWDDLKQYKVGILKGTLIDQFSFEQQGINFETSYNQESIFKKLKLGRIDLALEIDLVAHQTLHKLYLSHEDDFIMIGVPSSISPIAIMINENQTNAKELAIKYKKALAELIENGDYQKIIGKYYGHFNLPPDWFSHLGRFSRLYNFIESE